MTVSITVLGEVTARLDGTPVNLGSPRQRCVLAALAVDAGVLVPVDRLAARVWGAATPRRGRATLHSYLSRLRVAFAGGLAVVHRSDGYALMVDQADQAVDLLRFHALRDLARDAEEPARAVTLLTEALALWRGELLTGLSGEWVEAERARWEQERRAAELDLVDARLCLGQGEELVAQLATRVVVDPLDERVTGQYMLALYRAGQQARAQSQFRQLRERLVEALGTEPGAALQTLHRRILTADPGLVPTRTDTAAAPTASPTTVVPRQLLAAPAPFVGRGVEMDLLDAALSPGPDELPSGRTVLISTLAGTGGMGKTWLALRWAHQHLDRFPDGQLFADLRGFSPTGSPTRPGDVLGGFLENLGVDRDRQPADTDRRAELYRSLVADKRMLVVLDNAATTDQVVPLLPGGRYNTVLVTSRSSLRGLTARHGAHPVHLDVLSDAEARTFLTAALGPDRAAASAPAVARLVELCGGFPLALGLISARAAADRRLPLDDIVTELRTLGLIALESDDPTASLPAVLSWSLRHLTERQRQVFALLGLAPGPDISLSATAPLADLPERDAHAELRALADASLIKRTSGGRYAMHDLVRAYATTLADALPGDERVLASRRVVDFYAHTALAANRLLRPHHDPVLHAPPATGSRPRHLSGIAGALAWFDVEHACLLAAQRTAAAHSWWPAVWHLAWSLDSFYYRTGGYGRDWLMVWRAAGEAAAHLSDPTLSTMAERFLGMAHTELGNHENALHHLRRALALAERHDDPTHQARTHHMLARAWERRGDDHRALEHARRAKDLIRGLDQPAWEAEALNAVGWYAARLGDYDTARAQCEAALALNRHDHPTGAAAVLDSLGYIAHHSGHHHDAIDHYHRALALRHELGNTRQAASTLDALGHPCVVLGQIEEARAAWRQALRLYLEQGRHADAARVQRQLDEI